MKETLTKLLPGTRIHDPQPGVAIDL